MSRSTTTECFYATLNISKSATTDEIKKAYKKLAVKWHPDKNPDNQEEASERFKQIAEAYETLSDPELRRQYDNIGLSQSSRPGSDSFRSAPRANFSHSRGFSDKRAFDIFNSFFAEFEDFHQQAFANHRAAFANDPFGHHNAKSSNRRDDRRTQGQGHGMRDPFAGHSSLFGDDHFDPFMGGGFGGGFGGGLLSGGGLHSMMLGGGAFGDGMSATSFSSSSSSSFIGGSGGGRSVSTSTYIGPDGRKVTKKETTIIHPDGRRETTVDETVEEPPAGNRLGNGDGSGSRRLHIDRGGDSNSSDVTYLGSRHGPSGVGHTSYDRHSTGSSRRK